MKEIDLIKKYYEFFNNKNFEGMLMLVDKNVVHEPNQSEPRLGIQLFATFLSKMNESYAETLQNIVVYEAEEKGKFAAQFIVNGIYKKGENDMPIARNQAYMLPAGAFLEISNGLITKVTTYYNLELWLKLVK